MRKSLCTSGMYLTISLLTSISAFGQEEMKYDQQKIIKLDSESTIQEIDLPIKDSVSNVTIIIYSIIQAGDLTVEIYDPTGEKYGNFSIGCQGNSRIQNINNDKKALTFDSKTDEKATGNLFRSLKNPMEGDWKVKIVPSDAVGSVNIKYSLKSYKTSYYQLK